MISKDTITAIEKIIEYKFSNKKILSKSLVHSSFDNKSIKNKKKNISDFERYEFLGDRVLGLSVAYLIYSEFSSLNEGHLSKKFSFLVQKNFLYNIVINLGIDKHIIIPRDKALQLSKNKSILSDTLEAIIGAIFIDGGYNASNKFINKIWKPHIDLIETNISDPKTQLQELSQKKEKKLPIYKMIKKDGPPHSPNFLVSVSALKLKNIQGKGKSIREAEKNAAKNLLKSFNAKK